MRSIISTLSVLVLASGVFAQGLEPCYHTLDELYDFIFELQAANPTIVKVDSIGHSRGEMLNHQFPLYAVKISDNVQTFEDEPVNLIIGHIHAEEVAGMEATIQFMQRLVTNQNVYRTIREQTQVYIIPTMNPDGLEVISLGMDNTWRKNGYMPPEMHIDSCIVIQGVGRDSCGVDLNRNWDLNWIYGDSLFKEENVEPFDYFRGPAPFSEPESRAVRDFAMQIKPTVSIVWHSSRSGFVSERCIVAWQWGAEGNFKFAPDCTAIGVVNRGYMSKTWKYPGGQPYLEVIGATRNGALHDWFYRNLGTIQILTETSPRVNIQPTCSTLVDVNLQGLVNSLLPPMEWLSRRVINYAQNADMETQGAPLNIYTRDASNGQAISAEYRLLDSWTPILNPWYTNEQFGRATVLPPQGGVTVLARKEGFVNDTASATINRGGSAVNMTLSLQPLPWYNLQINVVNESSQAVPAYVYLDNGFPQNLYVTGPQTLSKPQGIYNVRVTPQNQNLVSRTYGFWLGSDSTFTFTLPTGNVVFTEDFEGGLGNWTAGGTGGAYRQDVDTTSLNYGICVHTNGPDYRENYGNNWDATFTYNNTINLSGGNAFHLRFDYYGRLDMPSDSFFVDASVNGIDWEIVRGFSDLERPWNRVWCDLSRWSGNAAVHIRFRLKTDAMLGDLGIHFDNIEVLRGVDLTSPQHPSPFPTKFALSKVYPNPFNPTTTIAYDAPGSGPIEFTIHNVLGQVVWSTTESVPTPGRYELRWNGVSNSDVPLTSGVYFVRMSAKGNLVGTRKLMLLK